MASSLSVKDNSEIKSKEGSFRSSSTHLLFFLWQHSHMASRVPRCMHSVQGAWVGLGLGLGLTVRVRVNR